MARPKLTRAQIRDRKAKRLAIALSVVLAGVLAFQGPKLLKMFSKSKAAAPAASTTTAGSPAAAGGSSGSAVGELVSASPPSQLGDFAGFALKDPFHPLVAAKTAAAAGLGTTTTASTTKPKPKPKPKTKPKPKAAPTTSTQSQPKPAIPMPGARPAPVPFTTSKPAPAPPNAALVTTNGKRQVVAVGDSFPRVGPLFKVVSLGRKGKTIKISVLGGSFTSGAHAIVVKKGETVTLLNQADGSRYVVKLVALATVADTSTSASAPAKGGSTTRQKTTTSR